MDELPLLAPPTSEPERSEFLGQLQALLRYCRLKECVEGSVIIEQGSASGACFLLLWGVVRIDQFDRNPDGSPEFSGRPALLDYGEPGDLVGESSLLGEPRHTARVSAMETCTLLDLAPTSPAELERFHHFIQVAPVDIWQRIALTLAANLRRRADAQEVFQLPSAPARISTRLLQLLHRFPGPDDDTIGIQLSAFDLSRQLAVDERTVERELARLRAENEHGVRIIEQFEDRIRIRDRTALIDYGRSRGRSLNARIGDDRR